MEGGNGEGVEGDERGEVLRRERGREGKGEDETRRGLLHLGWHFNSLFAHERTKLERVLTWGFRFSIAA